MLIDLDLATILLTLFIPLAIVYFQDKNSLTEKFLEYFLAIKRIVIEFSSIILLALAGSIADRFDLPSKLSVWLVGNQWLANLILNLLLLVPTIEIAVFYLRYFSFKSKSQSARIHFLFRFLTKRMLALQKKNRWIETNKKIEASQELNSDLLVKGVRCKYLGRRTGTASRIDIQSVQKKYPYLFLYIACGSEMRPGRLLGYLPKDRAEKQRAVELFISRRVSVSPDFEEKFTELLKIVIAEIQSDIPTRLYVQVDSNLDALLDEMAFVAETQCVFDRHYEVLSYLYYFLERLGETQDKQLIHIMTQFNRRLLLAMIKNENASLIRSYLSLSLRKEFLEIESDETVNSGLIYFFTEVLHSIMQLNGEVDEYLAQFVIVSWKLYVSLSEDQKASVKSQIEEKKYLLLMDHIREKSYVLEILYGIITEQKVIYLDANNSILKKFSATLAESDFHFREMIESIQLEGTP